jgi:predicted GIY-YIG superfamily endonuclease
VNHNKKEVYHGITKNPDERLDQHCNSNTKTIAHWNAKNDRITG